MYRRDGRKSDELRSITVIKNVFGYSAGSVLLEVGNTKVLCTVSMQGGGPHFLRGKKGAAWLSAEYAMLPHATQVRTARASSMFQRNGRSVEISRLIGRALRTVVNLEVFQDQTIMIDCDVLQADGGTRTASITGAYLALYLAQQKWLELGVIEQTFLTDAVSAVSIGVINGTCVLDPSYEEDHECEADFNFVIARSGTIVEIQGGAEKKPIPWDLFEQARVLAIQGAKKWFALFDEHLEDIEKIKRQTGQQKDSMEVGSLFSLKNRRKQE
ncbi:MAG: ribonuclease PH [bacterium]|nr:ribonuclease PH [bacterium]